MPTVDDKYKDTDEYLEEQWRRVVARRSFLKGVGAAGVAAVPASALLATDASARSRKLTHGDVAILRFLAAAELIESDLWEQYNELGGVNGGNKAYKLALENLDGDMPQYIADNTDDEESHRSSTGICAGTERTESTSTGSGRSRAVRQQAQSKRVG
jgi:hypothetical protein